MGIDLTVTSKGQVTLRREVLEHLGIRPGDRITIELLPAGGVQVRAKPRQPVSTIFGRLKREGERPLTIEEIREITEAGWAGEE